MTTQSGPISMNDGFTLTISDPNNLLGSNDDLVVKDINYVITLLNSYIVFKAPLNLEIDVAPASQNSSNTDGLLPSRPEFVQYNGQETLATIVKATTGIDPNGAAPDAGFTIYAGNDGSLKNYGAPLWFDPTPQIGVKPDIPAGSDDFIGIATHELFHCLGFASFPGTDAPWNQHLVEVNGVWYYRSTAVDALLGGDLPVGPQVQDHIGNTSLTYQPVMSDLMYSVGAYGENRADIGQLDLTVLKDLGYTIQNYQSLPLTDDIDQYDVTGTASGQTLYAPKASAVVAAGAGNGNDHFILPATTGNGNYFLDGGTGNGTVELGQSYAGFNVVPYGTDFLLQNKAGLDGVSLLRGIETIAFSDATVTLTDGSANLTIVATGTQTVVHGGPGANVISGVPGYQQGIGYSLQGLGNLFYDPDNGHFYQVVKLSSSAETWTQAEQAAAQTSLFGASGHLATIGSQQVENLVEQALAATGLNSQWFESYIGLHNVGGAWAWVDGQPFSYSDWSPNQTSFASWANAAYLSSDGWYAEDPNFNNQSAAPAQSAIVEFDTTAPPFTLPASFSVAYSGTVSQYSFGKTAAGQLTVTDLVAGRDGSDVLTNIQTLQFSDLTLLIAQAPGSGSTPTTGNITELYSAVLAREPDASGLDFYQNFLAANPNTPLQQFSEWFLASPEYTGKHAYAETAAGDEQFITDSYQNLLHRAPSSAELNFYESKVLAPAVATLTAGSAAYANAQFQAHALMLVYFSASPEFLSDVQVTAANPASAQHWLLLV